jgi:acyl-CoA reductase-like NAD-dependent aldehyde dehydrogenase
MSAAGQAVVWKPTTKNPDTGKRISRANTEAALVGKDVPGCVSAPNRHPNRIAT